MMYTDGYIHQFPDIIERAGNGFDITQVVQDPRRYILWFDFEATTPMFTSPNYNALNFGKIHLAERNPTPSPMPEFSPIFLMGLGLAGLAAAKQL